MRIKTTLVTPPSAEPVLLADAKLHLRIESTYTADDAYITALIGVARAHVESVTNRKLITQTWDAMLQGWPNNSDAIELPFGSLQSVTSIQYVDSEGITNTWPSSEYIVESSTEPGRIVLQYGQSWPSATLYPSNPIRIRFVCGYGTSGTSVPTPIIQAIKLIVSDLYEQREPFIVGRSYIPTKAVDMLLFPYRLWSFG